MSNIVSPSNIILEEKEKIQTNQDLPFQTPRRAFLEKINEGRFTSAQKNLKNMNRVPKYVLNEVNAAFSEVRKSGNQNKLGRINEIANTVRQKLSFGNTFRNFVGIRGKKPEGGKRRQTKKLRRGKGKNTRKH